MKNVVIINADNALNPSAKTRIIYTAIQKLIQQYLFYDSKQTFDAQDWLVGRLEASEGKRPSSSTGQVAHWSTVDRVKLNSDSLLNNISNFN